ncbi:MAG: hypothetical protein WDN28_21155 [Chthoniobacter sp.]
MLILAAAAVFGAGAIYSLPRMNELNKSKSDEAIQGRVAAFKHGYEQMQTNFFGIGKGEWGKEAYITAYVRIHLPPKMGTNDSKGRTALKPIRYSKAPHSSYNCIGAELANRDCFFLWPSSIAACARP